MMCVFPQCTDCKHFIGKKGEIYVCKAFPDGIPLDVFWNKIDHITNIENDNGIHFEPIPSD